MNLNGCLLDGRGALLQHVAENAAERFHEHVLLAVRARVSLMMLLQILNRDQTAVQSTNCRMKSSTLAVVEHSSICGYFSFGVISGRAIMMVHSSVEISRCGSIRVSNDEYNLRVSS